MTTEAAQEQAEASAARLLTLYGLYVAGTLTAPDFTRNAALGMYASKVVASRLADITVSTIANRPPVGIIPGEDHMDRLEEAVHTILEEAPKDEPEQPVERLTRLAEAETLLSHRASLHAALREQGYEYWTRVVEEGACEVCAPLAGEVQPISVGFNDHPGCRCSLIGVGDPAPVSIAPVREEPSPVIQIRKGVSRA